MIQAITVPGFGDYSLPEGKTFEEMQTAEKAQKIAFLILFGISFVGSFFLTPVCWPLAVFGAVVFAFFTIREVLALIGVLRRAPPMQHLFPEETLARLPSLGSLSEAEGFPAKNGPESHAWKLKLIQSARHSIVLSGNYCGGRAFDETLDLIGQRMREIPHLTVSILSSDVFITGENGKKIEEMNLEFQARFSCIITAEASPYVSPAGVLSASINHVKALVVDYGAYFMIGGTGIATPWTLQTGTDAPIDAQESFGFFYNWMDLKAYRDMDFVFRSDINGVGTRLHVELTKLVARYSSLPKTPVTEFPVEIGPHLEEFIEASVPDLRVALYASGPEHEKNPFLEEMVAQVKAARNSIVIDHMYFHPPKELMEALIDASNRGVEITILTNKLGDRSPGTHFFYAELSRYWTKKLFEGRPKENVQLYEYRIPHSTLHKKIVLIDGKTALLGSSNIGKKSLKSIDYEINAKVESIAFAIALMRSLEEDKLLCDKIPEEEAPEISIKTHIYSSIQSFFTEFL